MNFNSLFLVRAWFVSALLVVVFPGLLLAHPLADSLKPRVIVLTDISPNDKEPDDLESLIRLLAHADRFEIEGLVATTGWSNPGGNERPDLIRKAIAAYGADLPNLRKRSNQDGHRTDESRQRIGYWPSPGYLRSRTLIGSQVRGMSHIGDGNDSPGSELIIDLVDQNDERPIWVLAWGGANTLAQSLWRVRDNRNAEAVEDFLNQVHLYTITDQDRKYKKGPPYSLSSHQWMRKEFQSDLFFIWDESVWKYQNSTGRENWDAYATHIQGHGSMGDMYPKYNYGVEGDTPSFLYILPNGLNKPTHPGWGSWGGYFQWSLGPDGKTYAYTNHSKTDAQSISRKYWKQFYPATFNNFAARMDWAQKGTGNRNPRVVVRGDSSLSTITLTPRAGTTVTLDASQTYDPDGDRLSYKWWVLPEAGSYKQGIMLSDSTSSRITVQLPSDSAGEHFHVICEVTDDGTHNLTGYRRILFAPTSTKSR